MGFTYSTSDLSTPLAQVRLQIGDTEQATALLQDEEIQVYLAARSDSVLLASADICDALATRFARAYDFATDGQSFRRSQQAAAYRAMAQDLRARASGLGSVATARVDGYSQDIDSRSVDVTQENPRRRFYGPRDFPF